MATRSRPAPHEIDGRPALDAVKDILGSDLDQELEE